MKPKIIGIVIVQLLLLSCSSTISTSKKEYKMSSFSALKSDWEYNAKEWFLNKDTLTGKGGPMHWGVIESKKKLPKNFEITLKANMTKESLFEIMLNSEKEQYIRTYLYKIDQNIVIGKGVYKKGSDEYEKRGGPTLFKKNIKLENNRWYSIKIRSINNQLFFSVDDNTILECSIEKANLSQQGKIGFITNGEVKITNLVIKNIAEKR